MSIAIYADESYTAECLESEEFSLRYDPESNTIKIEPADITFENVLTADTLSDYYTKSDIDGMIPRTGLA
jgi:hypothetical protein